MISKPTFDEEIKHFKAVVRHIAKYEAKQGNAKWFQTDTNANLRRLNDLGVIWAPTCDKSILPNYKARKD